MTNNPENLRRKYPKGTEITLEYMEGQPGMPSGLKGSVLFIDDDCQIHIVWENGSTLPLDPYMDKFKARRLPRKKIGGK